MKVSITFLLAQAKRFGTTRNTTIFLLVWLISLYFTSEGIREYVHHADVKRVFREVEKQNPEQFINYTQYGLYGFRILFEPSPLSILSQNTGAASQLTAFVDSGIRLRLYRNVLGKSLFNYNRTGPGDFSGFILYFGSLWALAFGFGAFRRVGYLKYLCALSHYRKIFFLEVGARLFISSALFTFLLGSCWGLIALNGIGLTGSGLGLLAVYWLVGQLMLWFFLAIGVCAGAIPGKVTAMAVVVSLWFVFVFFVPAVFSRIVARSACYISSSYELEQQKLKILSNFEKSALDKGRRYTNLEEQQKSDRKLAWNYLNKEFKALMKLETKLEKQVGASVSLFHTLARLAPTSFYLASVTELDSRGYYNTLDFYKYVQRMKLEFLKYYIDKKFNSNYERVQPFIKKDENIYHAVGRLPVGIEFGLLISFIYILALFFVSFRLYKTLLFPRPGVGAENLRYLDIELKRGETYVLLTFGRILREQLYNLFSGFRYEEKGTVLLDELPVAEIGTMAGSKRVAFAYICRCPSFPGDFKVVELIGFLRNLLGVSKKEISHLFDLPGVHQLEKKRMAQLSEYEGTLLLLSVVRLKRAPLLLMEDLFTSLPQDSRSDLEERLKHIKEEGVAVLCLTKDTLLASRIGDRGGSLRGGSDSADFNDNIGLL